MLRDELEHYLNNLLSIQDFSDYCPNGLQIEGAQEIKKIITGVTASQSLISRAIDENADALLVHHGYFWKGENPCISHIKKQRIQALLEHQISLFAYHLPLDAHPEFGNNAQLAKLFNFQVVKGLEKHGGHDLGLVCSLDDFTPVNKLANQLSAILARDVQVLGPQTKLVKTLGLCSGAAQSMFEAALINHQVDAYLSGEVSEPTFHIAQEYQANYLALGHHASERYGVKALGEHLEKKFNVQVTFIDIDNPV